MNGKLFKVVSLLLLSFAGVAAAEFTLKESGHSPGWFFQPGEEVVAEVSLDESPGKAPRVSVTDFFGNETVLPVKFSPGDRKVQIRIPTGRPGYFVLALSGTELRQSFAVTPDQTKLATPGTPFGCNFHLTRLPYEEAVREVEIARRAGFVLRSASQFDWGDLRKREDADRLFRQFAPLNEFLRKSGMGVVGTIFYVARYASGAPAGSNYEVWSRVAPTDWADLTEFAARYAKECDFISHWEILNEPDAELFWRGSWKNWIANDDRGIIRDAVAYHAAARKGILSANPQAKILYMGVTAAIPKGATYRPFLQETLDAGIAANFDIMNLHYNADLVACRTLLAAYGAAERPVWVTEIGTHSAGGSSERLQIARELAMQLEQLANGAEKVFKYDLRNDGTTSHHEHNFGLIRRDFSPKPNFVAHAVMIGLLHDMKSASVLNIVHASDAGYCKGFAFDSASRGRINAIVLCDAPRAVVTLNTPDNLVTVTDVMGQTRSLKAENGRIRLELDELPLFITGRISGEAGAPVYPGDVTVRTYPMTPRPLLANGSFEEGNAHWQSTLGEAGRVEVTTDSAADGKRAMAVRIPAPGPSDFLGVFQRVDLRRLIGPLAENEYAVMTLTGSCRRDGIAGRGTNIGVNFFAADGSRILWRESAYRAGTHDWRKIEVTGEIPPETATLTVNCNVAPDTTGTVWLDDLSLSIEIRRRAGGGKERK